MASRPKTTEPRPAPRLYLISPVLADTSGFAPLLDAALDAADVAALLLRLATTDEGTLIKRARTLAGPAQARGVAVLLDGRPELVARARVDGVHATGLTDFTAAVEQLKPDGIVGVGGLLSRHDAMLAAEQGADYVMFGEPDSHGTRPQFAAIEERVAWWAEVFESPCVSYAGAVEEVAPLVAAGADFVALGDWLWNDPAGLPAALGAVMQALRLPEATA